MTHDWNHNGKVDFQDKMIQYQIYADIVGEDDETNYIAKSSYKSNGGSGLTSVQIYLLTVAFGLVAGILNILAGA